MTDWEAMMARLAELWHDPERTHGLARAGLEVLLAQPRADPTRVAAIGYCFGGHLVLELARAGAALAVVVGFHPRLATPGPWMPATSPARCWCASAPRTRGSQSASG
jgi:dienelactone hydrolase